MKKILMIIPFDAIYPPMGGGKLRTINLLNQLAKRFKVTVIVQQDIASFSKAKTDFPYIAGAAVLSTHDWEGRKDLFSLLPKKIGNALRFRYWNRSLKGPAEESYLRIYPVLRSLKPEHFDAIVLEDMMIIGLAKVVKRYWPSAHIVYDAYNVNTRLAEVELARGLISRSNFEGIEHAETHLYRTVNGIFACSEQDLTQLVSMNQGNIGGAVIPNGVGLPAQPRDLAACPPVDDILFCGSLDYLPNREGLTWFCKGVFPLVRKARPTVKLMVVGRGQPSEELATLLQQEGVVNYGMVDRVDVYYQKAALAVVPLLSGSGTRLKLLEAMGQQVAVVSTAIGAEGIDYSHGKDILIADDEQQFAAAILQLLANREQAVSMANEAFSFVKAKYDWDRVGEKLQAYFNN